MKLLLLVGSLFAFVIALLIALAVFSGNEAAWLAGGFVGLVASFLIDIAGPYLTRPPQ